MVNEMKVEAEVKIKILDGEAKGAVHTFTTIGDTQTIYEKIGTIERLRLEWNHFFPYKRTRAKREDGEQDE
jgi:hypothetical protein